MKLKQLPEDFQVEELTDIEPAGDGSFAFYRLEKRGWTTTDALAAVRRRWHIDARRLSFGGLKDRHAHTVQYLTIDGGPQRPLTHDAVALHYLGQVPEPYTSQAIRANRFRLTLRDVDPGEAGPIEGAIREVSGQGVPNYFDDQRFGSVTGDGGFVAREMVLGRYEDALRLALASPYEGDRGPRKKEKALLRAHWGDWQRLRERLPRGDASLLVDYLACRPGDFRGALARLRPDLRGLYLSAYQSHLWNRMLAHWLGVHCPLEQLLSIRLRLGNLPMHRGLGPDTFASLAALQLPLPTARTKLDPADARLPHVNAILAEEGLELRQLQFKHFREMFFSKGERAALCLPRELHSEFAADDLHPGKQKLLLGFDLPRGSYATLIVKRIQAAGGGTTEGAVAGL